MEGPAQVRRPPRHAAGICSLVVGRDEPHLLQDFLAARLGLSRRTAKAAIDGRSVWVDRKCVWMARYRLETGSKVELPEKVVKAARRQSSAPAGAAPAVRRHVRVLWSDDAYLVADKPAGMLSCGDPGSVEAVLREQESVPTLQAVHRLDRDTTGCLLFARNHAAFAAAVELFKTHRVVKVYHAVAAGKFKYAHHTVEAPLDGQQAVSVVAREASSADASLLRVRIETGRTNQIRRHLAGLRAPVIGDRVFGFKSVRDPRLLQVPRQMLHASLLELPHPLGAKRKIAVHSPLPADFRACLRLFGMGK